MNDGGKMIDKTFQNVRAVCKLLGVKPGEVFSIEDDDRPCNLYRITNRFPLEHFYALDKRGMWMDTYNPSSSSVVTLGELLLGTEKIYRVYPNSPLKGICTDMVVTRCDYFAGGWHRPKECDRDLLEKWLEGDDNAER